MFSILPGSPSISDGNGRCRAWHSLQLRYILSDVLRSWEWELVSPGKGGVLGVQDLLPLFPGICLIFALQHLTTITHWKEKSYKEKFSRQEWCGHVCLPSVASVLHHVTLQVSWSRLLFSKATKPFIATALMRFGWLSGSSGRKHKMQTLMCHEGSWYPKRDQLKRKFHVPTIIFPRTCWFLGGSLFCHWWHWRRFCQVHWRRSCNFRWPSPCGNDFVLVAIAILCPSYINFVFMYLHVFPCLSQVFQTTSRSLPIAKFK